MARLEFFFDCSSPWTYLAFHRIEDAGRRDRRDARVAAVPGRRRVQHGEPQRLRAARAPGARQGALLRQGPADWARLLRSAHRQSAGVSGEQREGDARLLRGAGGAAPAGIRARRVRDLLGRARGHFARRGARHASSGASVSTPPTSSPRSTPPAYKDKLRANTDELIARGGFGSPTMFVDGDDMYFGNDRLVLVRERLLRR